MFPFNLFLYFTFLYALLFRLWTINNVNSYLNYCSSPYHIVLCRVLLTCSLITILISMKHFSLQCNTSHFSVLISGSHFARYFIRANSTLARNMINNYSSSSSSSSNNKSFTYHANDTIMLMYTNNELR